MVLIWLYVGVMYLIVHFAPSSDFVQDEMKAALGPRYEWVWDEGGPVSSWSIPANSMAPTLMTGDRVLGVRLAGPPRRGEIWVFQHPHSDRRMVKRVVGLPGDKVQIKAGRLILNGKTIERKLIRQVDYWEERRITQAIEYAEQLPGEARPHLIHEFSDFDSVDETPLFVVPAGHVFFMGDNRDNSEDSRAPSGHRDLAARSPEAWPYRSSHLPADRRDDAIGYVPFENLIARVATVRASFRSCPIRQPAQGSTVVCLPPPIGQHL